ncbi:MAG TPA: hypothetical protein VGI83_02965, partial [Gemmatimonadales bacterium]
ERGRDILIAYRDESWHAPALGEGEFALDAASWVQLRAWGTTPLSMTSFGCRFPLWRSWVEKDPLVPVTASVARYDQTAAIAPRVHRGVVFPGADHRLRTAAAGDFASGYLALHSTWWRRSGRPKRRLA